MNFSLNSQAYYDHSFQKVTSKPNQQKEPDDLSNISFSDDDLKRGKTHKKTESPHKTGDSPFASLFEINPLNKLQKNKNPHKNLFFSQHVSVNESANFLNKSRTNDTEISEERPTISSMSPFLEKMKNLPNSPLSLQNSKATEKTNLFSLAETSELLLPQRRKETLDSSKKITKLLSQSPVQHDESFDKKKEIQKIIEKKDIFETPKYKNLSKINENKNTPNESIKPKSYGDIFKQRIDQKKVGDLATQAKQNTLVSISREAVPNKKYVAKYMENFIKKNKLDPKEKEPQDFQKFNKLLFEESSNPVPKKRKKQQKTTKFCMFAQEAEGNSEESVSDCDDDLSIEGDIRKLSNLDIDFEEFFEDAMDHPFISKKNFKKKGKIGKKLEVKSNRVRIKKDKQVKEYLQDTYFTYTSKPLKWQKLAPIKDKAKPYEFRLPECESFIGKTGIKIPFLFTTIKPYDYFLQFMPESIFEETSRLTNISASLEFYNFARNKNKEWKEVSSHDIKKWFGLIFLFGIVRKYSVHEYWSTDPLLGLNCVNKIMNKGRFDDIRRFLSFYDKRKKAEYEKVYPPQDPFYKFRYLLDHINDACRKAYVPEREISVDESMISYQGIHRLKVYMPRKPIKWGFKAFVLSESSSGYLCNMILNEGHKRGENEDLLSKRIVLQILHGYEHQGYRVYMDRWYTSADLLSEMKKRGFGGCGTIFLSRVGLVNALKKDVREFKDPGEATFFTNNEMTFVAWYHYRRQVYVLSNFHSPDWVKVEKIRKIAYFCKKEYKIYDYDAPKMIREYNTYMGGVDLFNQRVSYYTVDYDIMKWYMRLVFWIFEIAMVNSYLLYCKVMKVKNLNPIASSEFRMEVIRHLTQWDHDPTKAVFRKGITNQMLETEAQMDDVDKDFHNLNIKRKSEYDLDKMKIFSELKLEVKCTLEYIGIGVCDLCKKKRGKLKKTEFWCKACHKGLCITCFDKHRLERIFTKITNDKEVNNLFSYMINKKKVKVEKTSKFYENQVLKKKPHQNNKKTENNDNLNLNLEIPISETNASRNKNNITPILINDMSSNNDESSSEESVIMEVRKKIDNRMKSNFDGYLRPQVKLTEELKQDHNQFQQLKEDLDNFYSFNENNHFEMQKNEFLVPDPKLFERLFLH